MQQAAATAQICPVCDSESFAVAWRDAGREFGECQSCGLAFVRPFERGAADTVGDAASSITKPAYTKMMRERAQAREDAARLMAVKRLEAYSRILERQPESVCEIGAGDGAFSAAYAALGVEYVGIDINAEIVAEARALGRNVHHGAPELALSWNRRFDVIAFSQVLEHVLEPKEFLASVKRLLADDGIIHLDVPNHDGLIPLTRKVYPRGGEYGFLQPPHHQIAYTTKTLRRLLEQTGFNPLFIEPKGNLDQTWGQLFVGDSTLGRLSLRAADWFKMGSLLVALAKHQPTE